MDGLETIKEFIKKCEPNQLVCYDFGIREPSDIMYTVKCENKYNIYNYTNLYLIELEVNTNYLYFSINSKVRNTFELLFCHISRCGVYINERCSSRAETKKVIPLFSKLLDVLFKGSGKNLVSKIIFNLFSRSRNNFVAVYKNKIYVAVDKQSNIKAIIEALNEIVPFIDCAPTRSRLNYNSVPEDLREVLSLAEKYAINDNDERAMKQAKMSKRTKLKIMSIVEPRIALINNYLDGFKDGSLSEEAQLIGNIAEFYNELTALQNTISENNIFKYINEEDFRYEIVPFYYWVAFHLEDATTILDILRKNDVYLYGGDLVTDINGRLDYAWMKWGFSNSYPTGWSAICTKGYTDCVKYLDDLYARSKKEVMRLTEVSIKRREKCYISFFVGEKLSWISTELGPYRW